jgi:hypothetical protein
MPACFRRSAFQAILAAGLICTPAASAQTNQALPPLATLAPRTGIPRDSTQVRLVTGTVQWRHGAGSWAAVQPDQFFHAGDEVRTGKSGLLILELALQGGFVNVFAGSTLAIAELRRLPGFEGPQSTTLVLHEGKAFVRLRKFNRTQSRLRVNAPNGAAVVRGTEFVVATAAGTTPTTTIGVATGLVRVEAQGAHVDVPPGNISTIVGQQAPTEASPRPAVPIQVTRFLPLGGRLDIAGTAAPGASIIIAGVQVQADAGGRFQAQVPLATTAQEVTIKALEPTGNIETLSLSVGR